MPSKTLHIVHTESSGGWGGQEIRILSEAREFIKLGHQVTLVVSDNSPIAVRSKEYNIPTVELPIGKKTLKGLRAMRRWISENNFDVINTHSSSDSWMVALGMRLAFKKKPLVRTRHVSAPVSNNMATTWLYQKASDYIVTTGVKLRDTLIKENAIAAEKIASVATGVDCSIFKPADDKQAIRAQLQLPLDKTIIGIVATLRSWKGHLYLLEAIKQLDDDNVHCLIVGNGPQWDQIKNTISDLKLEQQVTMCGEQKNVVPWLQAMDIFTLPSYANEGVPQGITQAMACGLPIISTNAGSISELLSGNNGITCEQKSASSLKESLKTLLDSQELRESYSQKGIDFINKHYSIETMTKSMEKIFKNVIEK